MSSYSSGTRGELVVTSLWSEFFFDLAKTHQGRPVAIEEGRTLPPGKPLMERVPFQTIEYHADHRPETIVFTIGQGPATKTYTIEDPSLVWRARDEHGDTIIVKLSDAQGRTVFLLFG